MHKYTQGVRDDIDRLVDEARALVTATADLTGDGVAAARERLAASLDRCKSAYGRARDRAVEGAEAADEAVRGHPYESIVVGMTVGAILGCLVAIGLCRR